MVRGEFWGFGMTCGHWRGTSEDLGSDRCLWTDVLITYILFFFPLIMGYPLQDGAATSINCFFFVNSACTVLVLPLRLVHIAPLVHREVGMGLTWEWCCHQRLFLTSHCTTPQRE